MYLLNNFSLWLIPYQLKACIFFLIDQRRAFYFWPYWQRNWAGFHNQIINYFNLDNDFLITWVAYWCTSFLSFPTQLVFTFTSPPWYMLSLLFYLLAFPGLPNWSFYPPPLPLLYIVVFSRKIYFHLSQFVHNYESITFSLFQLDLIYVSSVLQLPLLISTYLSHSVLISIYLPHSVLCLSLSIYLCSYIFWS